MSMAYIFLMVAFTCNAAANILLKVAASRGFSFGGLLRGQFTAAHGIAGLAVVLFVANLGAYLVALSRLPLSLSYPVMIGMTFFIVTVFALSTGERINTLEIVGLSAILGGIMLVVYATAY